MRLLLDTHVLLWWLADDPQLSVESRNAIGAADHLVYVSAVNIWEIVIKRDLGKLTLPDEWYDAVADDAFRRLPITWEHAHKVSTLPNLHRDPFDRLLVAQAMCEDLVLVTHDDLVAGYGVATIKT